MNNDVWQYYDKLVSQAEKKCFDVDKASDAVTEVYEKIASGKIDLTDVKDPYKFLVSCVQNQALSNNRKLKAKKRQFDIQNVVLVDDNEKLEGMAADTVFKQKFGEEPDRPKAGDYGEGD